MEFNEPWLHTCSAVGLAARNGELAQMKRLLAQGRPVDVSDNRGWRPLHEAAAMSKDISCLEELLKEGSSDVNWKTHEGETAILLVCKRRRVDTEAHEAAKLLIQHGANMNIEDNDQETPLLSATRAGLEKTVELLLKSPEIDVNKGDFSGWRPLHEATNLGYIGMVQSMLEAGATLDVQDECGMTPLFTAAQFGKFDCLKLLLETAKTRSQLDLVNRGAQDWATPLMIAAQQGFLNCVQLLLSYEADPNLKTFDNVTALHLAVQGKHDNVLKILLNAMNIDDLKKNCILEIEKVNNRFRAVSQPEMINPLQLAIEWRSHKCLSLLLEIGFPVDSLFIRTELQRERLFVLPLPPYDTPLSLAINNSDKEAIKILVDAKASCNSNCSLVLHPLLADALGTRLHDNRILELLVRNGANINYHRRGPLANDCLLAALWNPLKLVKLLRFGADPSMFFTDCISSSVLVEGLFRAYQTQEPVIHVIEIFLMFMIPNRVVQDTVALTVDRSREQFASLHKQALWNSCILKCSSPQSLKSLCRIKIRKILYALYNTSLEKNIPELNLPFPLPLYLCYDELDNLKIETSE